MVQTLASMFVSPKSGGSLNLNRLLFSAAISMSDGVDGGVGDGGGGGGKGAGGGLGGEGTGEVSTLI